MCAGPDRKRATGQRWSLNERRSGRLIFALLHQGRYLTEKDQSFDPELLSTCRERIHAQPDELNKMGGMGDIFVDLARRGGETMSNPNADLCKIRPRVHNPKARVGLLCSSNYGSGRHGRV